MDVAKCSVSKTLLWKPNSGALYWWIWSFPARLLFIVGRFSAWPDQLQVLSSLENIFTGFLDLFLLE